MVHGQTRVPVLGPTAILEAQGLELLGSKRPTGAHGWLVRSCGRRRCRLAVCALHRLPLRRKAARSMAELVGQPGPGLWRQPWSDSSDGALVSCPVRCLLASDSLPVSVAVVEGAVSFSAAVLVVARPGLVAVGDGRRSEPLVLVAHQVLLSGSAGRLDSGGEISARWHDLPTTGPELSGPADDGRMPTA